VKRKQVAHFAFIQSPTPSAVNATAAVQPFGFRCRSIDIHLPVSGAAGEVALDANKFLRDKLKNTEVDFSTKDKPHITLYLSQWPVMRMHTRA
jgi:hypothetical protein